MTSPNIQPQKHLPQSKYKEESKKNTEFKYITLFSQYYCETIAHSIAQTRHKTFMYNTGNLWSGLLSTAQESCHSSVPS